MSYEVFVTGASLSEPHISELYTAESHYRKAGSRRIECSYTTDVTIEGGA